MGAQGSGKTTLGRELQRLLPDLKIIALDGIRAELCSAARDETHGPEVQGAACDYAQIQRFLTPARERRVRRIARARFRETRARYLYVDQMNLFPSSRVPFLRPQDLDVGLVLEIPLKRVLEQHARRADKLAAIHRSLVAASYMRRVAPQPGEFDFVIRYRPTEEASCAKETS